MKRIIITSLLLAVVALPTLAMAASDKMDDMPGMEHAMPKKPAQEDRPKTTPAAPKEAAKKTADRQAP